MVDPVGVLRGNVCVEAEDSGTNDVDVNPLVGLEVVVPEHDTVQVTSELAQVSVLVDDVPVFWRNRLAELHLVFPCWLRGDIDLDYVPAVVDLGNLVELVCPELELSYVRPAPPGSEQNFSCLKAHRDCLGVDTGVNEGDQILCEPDAELLGICSPELGDLID